MDDRTWEMLTKAACSLDQRVEGQVASLRGFGTRTQPFEKIELELGLDDGHCSCHPHAPAQAPSPASPAA